MVGIALAIAPVFALIMGGYGLRRVAVPSAEFWSGADRLVYFVLMPALFFVRVSEADLGGPGLRDLGVILYGGFFAALAFGVVAALWLGRGGAVATSVIQGSGRFNTFVALAVAEALGGAAALQLAVLGAALLVPGVNLVVVALFAVFLPRAGQGALRGAAISLFTNPLILSIAAGAAAGVSGVAPIPILSETLSVLGEAALPLMLLCVGASLRLRGLQADLVPLVMSCVGKLVVFPLVVLGLVAWLSPDPALGYVALIYAALPTGVAAYTLARQMGGDAPLMSTMITVQTLLAFAVMPFWLTLGPLVWGR